MRKSSQGKQIDLILLHFSKAFDKVNHSKLILKLHSYGIRDSTLHWIQAFLSNRQQRVVVEGEESDSVPLTSGVPQGSVLGQILFLAYINDLPQDIVSQLSLFADVTAIYLTIESKTDSDCLQRDLDRLQAWESKWDMELNPSKCQVIHVTASSAPLKTEYILHGRSQVLGTWGGYLQQHELEHACDQSCSKWKQASRIYQKKRVKTKSPKVRRMAYQTLIRPQLLIALAILDPHTKENGHKIEMVLRWWTTNDYARTTSVTSLLHQLDWQTFEGETISGRLCYKIVNGLVAVPLPDYIQPTHRISRYCHSMTFRQIHTGKNSYKLSIPSFLWLLSSGMPTQKMLQLLEVKR